MPRNPFDTPDGDFLDPFSPRRPPADALSTPTRIPWSGARPRRADPSQSDAEGASEDYLPLDGFPEGSFDKPVRVILSNPRWEMEYEEKAAGKTVYGDRVVAVVDVRFEPPGTTPVRLHFLLEAMEGECEPVSHHMDHRAGTAKCAFDLPQARDEAGNLLTKTAFQFTVRASGAKRVQGPALPVEEGPPFSPFASTIYYSPAQDKYLVFETTEEFESLKSEIELLELIRGKTRKAWEMDDEAARRRALEELDKQCAELFDGDGSLGDTEGVLEELLLVRRNPRDGALKSSVYIRSHTRKGNKIKGHFLRHDDERLKKNLNELLKKAPGSKELPPYFDQSDSLHATLFEKNWTGQSPIRWLHKSEKQGKLAGQAFTFTQEAALCRFIAGTELGVEASLKDRTLRFGGSTKVSYAVFEGRMEGTFPLPEKGLNLLEYITRIDYLEDFIKQGRKCLLRVYLKLTGQAFVGLSARAVLAFPHLDLSKVPIKDIHGRPTRAARKAEGKVSGSAEGFAGAQTSAGLTLGLEWSPATSESSYEDLSTYGLTVGGMVGAGGEAEGKIDYLNGKFRFKLSAAGCVGLGLKGSFEFDVDVKQGCLLLGQLFNAVDFHFVGEVQEAAFRMYTNYTFTLMTEGEEALTRTMEVAGEVIEDFQGWLRDAVDVLGSIKKNLGQCISHRSTLAGLPPETLARVLLTIMQTREEDDFERIRRLLSSTINLDVDIQKNPSANHKLKCVLRHVSGIRFPQSGPDREDLKSKALQAGIKRINDFFDGAGTDGKIAPQDETSKQLNILLKKAQS